MLLKQDFLDILNKVWYKEWRVVVGTDDGIYCWLQWRFAGPYPGEEQTTRKWRLSPYMTPSEVVQTAFKAVLTAEEHEVREAFRYREEAIFGPHFDVDALHELVVSKRISLREEASGS